LSNQRLAKLLAELNRELEDSKDLDPDTRALLEKLDEDIERLTGDDESPLERAQQLESRFAAEHPVAARLAGELADVLAKMGI
jgi:predicted nucleotidyltransferase